VTGEIGAGLMILLGVGREDTSAVASSMAEKCANLRIFRGPCGKDEPVAAGREGSAMVVSSLRSTATLAGSGGELYCRRSSEQAKSLV